MAMCTYSFVSFTTRSTRMSLFEFLSPKRNKLFFSPKRIPSSNEKGRQIDRPHIVKPVLRSPFARHLKNDIKSLEENEEDASFIAKSGFGTCFCFFQTWVFAVFEV